MDKVYETLSDILPVCAGQGIADAKPYLVRKDLGAVVAVQGGNVCKDRVGCKAALETLNIVHMVQTIATAKGEHCGPNSMLGGSQ